MLAVSDVDANARPWPLTPQGDLYAVSALDGVNREARTLCSFLVQPIPGLCCYAYTAYETRWQCEGKIRFSLMNSRNSLRACRFFFFDSGSVYASRWL